jgi:hypothetical protein
MLILSNIHQIRVGNPVSREEDRLAQDFFSQEVGMSLYLGGSQSPFLRKGMEHLEELAERYAESLVGAKAALVVASSVARPFFRIEDPNKPVLTRVHAPDPERALTLTQSALGVYKRIDSPAQNIAYHQLARSRAEFFTAQGQEQRARQELTALRNDLQPRGVNESVLNAIKAHAESLPSSSRRRGRGSERNRS